MVNQPEGLISVLLDCTADLAERDDAAMDLGAYSDDDRVLEALIQIAADTSQDELLHWSCGESIADIWLARRYYNKQIFDSLTAAAQQEVYVNADVTKLD